MAKIRSAFSVVAALRTAGLLSAACEAPNGANTERFFSGGSAATAWTAACVQHGLSVLHVRPPNGANP